MSQNVTLSSADIGSMEGPLQLNGRLPPHQRALFARIWSRLEASQHDPRLGEIRDRIAFQVWRRSEQGRDPVTRWMNAPVDAEQSPSLPLCTAQTEALFAERSSRHGDSDVEIVQGWLSSSCRWMAADRAAYLLRASERRRPQFLEIDDGSGASSSAESNRLESFEFSNRSTPAVHASPRPPGSPSQILDSLQESASVDREGIKRALKELGALWHRKPPSVGQIPDVMRQFSHRPELLTPLLALMLEALPGAIAQSLPAVWCCAEHRFSHLQQRPLLELLIEQMLRHKPPVALLNALADWVDPSSTSFGVVERLLHAGVWRANFLEALCDRPLTAAILETLQRTWSRGLMTADDRDRLLAMALAQETRSVSGAVQSALVLLSWDHPQAQWEAQGLNAALNCFGRSPETLQACLHNCWERRLVPLQFEMLLLQEVVKTACWQESILGLKGCLEGFLASKAWDQVLARAAPSECRDLCRLFLNAAQAAEGGGARSDVLARQFATLFLRDAGLIPAVVEQLELCNQVFRLELFTALLTLPLRLMSQASAALWRAAFQTLTAEELNALLREDTRRVAGDWLGAEGSPFRARLALTWEWSLRSAEGSLPASDATILRLPHVVETLSYAHGKMLETNRRSQGGSSWPNLLIGPLLSASDRPDQKAELLIVFLLAMEDLHHHPWCATPPDKRAPALQRTLIADVQASAIPSAVLHELVRRFEGFGWEQVSAPQQQRCHQALSRMAHAVMQRVIGSLAAGMQGPAGHGSSSRAKLPDDLLVRAIRDLGDLQSLLVALGELGKGVIPGLLKSLDLPDTVASDQIQRRLLESLFRNHVIEWPHISRRGGHALFRVWRAEPDQAFQVPPEIPRLWSGVVDWVVQQPEEDLAACASEALSWLGDFRLPLAKERQDVQLMLAAMERLIPLVADVAQKIVSPARREGLWADLTSGMLALPLGLMDRQYGEEVATAIREYCRRILKMGLPSGDLPLQDLHSAMTLLEARQGILELEAPEDPKSYLKLWKWAEPGDEAEKGSSAVMQLGLLQQACLDFVQAPRPTSRALLVATLVRTIYVSMDTSISFGDPIALLPQGAGIRFGLLADALSILNSRHPLLERWGSIHLRVRHSLIAVDEVSLPELQELAAQILEESREKTWTLARTLLFTLGAHATGGREAVVPVERSQAKVFFVSELVKPLQDDGLNRSLAEWLRAPGPLTRSKIAAWMGMIAIDAQRQLRERQRADP